MCETNRASAWLVAACCALVLSVAPSAFAQPMVQAQPSYSATAYQQLRTLSQQLETVAARARDEAKLDERNHGSGHFTDKLSDFVRDAHIFRSLIHEDNVPASKINDQIRKLMDTGRKVQEASAKAKWHDPQTDADWRATLGVLDQINTEFMVANGLKTPSAVATSGHGNWSTDGRTLLSDISRRSDEALRISQVSSPSLSPRVQNLRDQVAAFSQSFDETGQSDTNAKIAQMLADAKGIQSEANAQSAPPQLRDDISSIVGSLVQMRDMAANLNNNENNRALGTSGSGSGGTAVDRNYATMDFGQMVNDLGRRVTRAYDLAGQTSDLGDVSGRISDFNNKVRDFNANSATMSREDRRDAIDHLLEDAQRTQRDLAKNNASSALVDQWNGIVTLLAKMRDAS